MKLPWPELPSAHRPEESIREILDYLCWISVAMSDEAYRAGSDLTAWRVRVQDAYRALFLPPVPNHGDPYPPDVPPPRTPGIWPDVPSAGVPGMTLRHQLKVISVRAFELRKMVWVHAREVEVAEWDRRLSLAREALDQGEAHPMPASARTQPSEAVLAEARAQEEAMLEHARKRTLRLQRLQASARKKEAGGKKQAAAKRKTSTAGKKAAPKKKGAARKKAIPKKKATPKRKAAPKKKAAPKRKATPKKKATPKRKATPRKKPAPKKKPAAGPKATTAKRKAGGQRATTSRKPSGPRRTRGSK